MIIGIDPSLNHIGLSYLRGPEYDPRNVQLDQIESTEESRGDARSIRNVTIGKAVMSRIRSLGLQNANVGVVEYPAFQDSQRGHVAAKQGHTFGLAYMCGYLSGAMPETTWYFPTPIEWKGTQSKGAMGIKFTRWTGKMHQIYSDHQFESALLIKWYLDKYHR